MSETLSSRLQRYFDAVLGFVAPLVAANPRKAAVLVVALAVLVVLT